MRQKLTSLNVLDFFPRESLVSLVIVSTLADRSKAFLIAWHVLKVCPFGFSEKTAKTGLSPFLSDFHLFVRSSLSNVLDRLNHIWTESFEKKKVHFLNSDIASPSYTLSPNYLICIIRFRDMYKKLHSFARFESNFFIVQRALMNFEPEPIGGNTFPFHN